MRIFAIESKTYIYVIRTQRVNVLCKILVKPRRKEADTIPFKYF